MSQGGDYTEHIGPPSRQILRMERAVRRLRPVIAGWRATPRGIRMLRAATNPRNRVPMTKGSTVAPATVGGVPSEWVRAPRAAETDDGAVLYIHGGGYVLMSPRSHRGLTSAISHVTGLPVLAIDYRLAPEAPITAATEDSLAAYRELLERFDPARMMVMGDSAGGGLTHALALHVAEAGLPRPAGLVMLSPWNDLTLTSGSVTENAAKDALIPPRALQRYTTVASRGFDRRDWRCSPLFAPDELQRQLPPALFQVGSTELLRDDSASAAATLDRLGVPTTLQIFERVPHVPPMWTGSPEAADALRRIGAFTRSVLGTERERLPA
jgi:monoterpene epsilon-lactone hydrolase